MCNLGEGNRIRDIKDTDDRKNAEREYRRAYLRQYRLVRSQLGGGPDSLRKEGRNRVRRFRLVQKIRQLNADDAAFILVELQTVANGHYGAKTKKIDFS